MDLAGWLPRSRRFSEAFFRLRSVWETVAFKDRSRAKPGAEQRHCRQSHCVAPPPSPPPLAASSNFPPPLGRHPLLGSCRCAPTMDFINKATSSFLHQGGSQQHGSSGGGQAAFAPPSPQPPRSPGPPPASDPNVGLPPDWVAEFDHQGSQRWYYVNRRTSERTWNRPAAPAPGDPRAGLPPGWVAEWAAQDNRWFYVNTHTGERTWNRPGGGGPPVQQTQVYTEGRTLGGGTYQATQVTTQTAAAPKQKNHNLAYGAAGAAAGLVGGALLMHEGHKVGT